jgi:hypothetical protein
MKTIGNIITVLAAFMFMLGMCAIDGNPAFALATMFVCGIWLAAYGYYQEEKRLKEGKR